jgi:hypothetical protein
VSGAHDNKLNFEILFAGKVIKKTLSALQKKDRIAPAFYPYDD